MQKTILTIALATLCLFFKARSQDKAVDVTAKGIQVGQMIPNVELKNIHNYKTKTATISDFQGKLLILDFWATWCSPCVAMRPKMEKLQQQFNDRIQFLSVTTQKTSKVLPFLEVLQKGKPSILPEIIEDRVLNRLFPHVYLPHYVWVDPRGVVKAITGADEVTEENINKILKGQGIATQKRDVRIPYDSDQPLFMKEPLVNEGNLRIQSILTGSIDGLGGGHTVKPVNSKTKRITCRNTSLPRLYALAYQKNGYFGKNRMRIETAINSPIRRPTNEALIPAWWAKNTYCYELIAPEESFFGLMELMRGDLNRYFPEYRASIENRKTKCLVLKRTSGVDKLKTSGGSRKSQFSDIGCQLSNTTIYAFIMPLNIKYQQSSLLPLVDGTGYSGMIDLEINAPLSDIKLVNKELLRYDLQFIEEDRNIDLLVIRDKN